MRYNILLVQSDKDLSKYLKEHLISEGFGVDVVHKGVNAVDIIRVKRPDLVVLDWDLAGIKAESICSDIHVQFPTLPIITISSLEGKKNVLKAFSLGAVDYISKPFNVEELVVRIHARLDVPQSNDTLKIADLIMNDKNKQVIRGNRRIRLSRKEYDLLKYLMVNRIRVLNRDMILSRVWDSVEFIEPRVVDVYIGYLRAKIDSKHKHKLIRTIRGFGYSIQSNDELTL